MTPAYKGTRAAKQVALGQAKQRRFVGRTTDGIPYTLGEAAEYDSDLSVARHEASHAVAAWMQGMPIGHMQFNDDRNDKAHHADTLSAVTITGIPLPEMQSAPVGGRFIYGCQHAFVTLAGVFGSGDAESANPLRVHETRLHIGQALGRLVCIAGISEKQARSEVARLLRIVTATMSCRPVQNAIAHLATELIQHRKLTGEKIVGVIETRFSEGAR